MTVYLVEECGGSYEDTWSRVIKCFSDVKVAEEFVNSKKTLYNYHESFRETLIETYDLFNVLMNKYWFKKPMIDTNDYPMDKEANVFKNCVKETIPHLESLMSTLYYDEDKEALNEVALMKRIKESLETSKNVVKNYILRSMQGMLLEV